MFYDVSKLPVDIKLNIIKDAKELCYKFNIDILDCNISWARQQANISYEQILKLFNNKSHFVVILREYPELYGEIGFSTMDNPDYFLFMYLTVDNLYKIIDKYDLKIKDK